MKKYLIISIISLSIISAIAIFIIINKDKNSNLSCNCVNKCESTCPLNQKQPGCNCKNSLNITNGTCSSVEPSC